MKKLNKIFLACIFLLSLARAGDKVGNGGGFGEQNVEYAWLTVDFYISYCLNQPSCGISDDERALLEKIRAAVPQERRGEGVVFKSGRENPGFFDLEHQGETRSAKTGDNVGDAVYVNTDLLYPTNPVSKQPEPKDIPSCVALLVHELGHHQGVKAHDVLDALGVKVKRIILLDVQEMLYAGYGQKEIRLLAGETDAKQTYRQILFISDGQTMLNITDAIAKKGFYGPRTKVLIRNVQWEDTPLWDDDLEYQELVMVLHAYQGPWHGKLRVSAGFKPLDKSIGNSWRKTGSPLRLVPDSIRIEVIP